VLTLEEGGSIHIPILASGNSVGWRWCVRQGLVELHRPLTCVYARGFLGPLVRNTCYQKHASACVCRDMQFCCSPMRPDWWQNCEAILRCRCVAQGIGGMRSSHAAGGAGAIAESRKARFFARSAKKAPKFRIEVKLQIGFEIKLLRTMQKCTIRFIETNFSRY
jgi:hypothetical protein